MAEVVVAFRELAYPRVVQLPYTYYLYATWAQHMVDIFHALSCMFLSYPVLYVYNVVLKSCKFSVFAYKADFSVLVEFW